MTRSGPADHLDIDDTIRSTAKKGGWLDLKMVPEQHNSVKVLLFFDVGGSMDPFIRTCEELFSAARNEFKHMEYFYFHNCLYEAVWKNNVRRMGEQLKTFDLLNTYGPDYKVIIVGDAAMSPYEVSHAGGSVEHWNDEPGEVWLRRVMDHFLEGDLAKPRVSGKLAIYDIDGLDKRDCRASDVPLTLQGLEEGMRSLSR